MVRLSCGWLVLGWLAIAAGPGLAQVPVQDGTLGTENSNVDSTTLPNIGLIRGGAYRGNNLFHSFESFDVGENLGAYFLVRDGLIENIFARVTGTKASEILGVLGMRIDDGSFTTPSPATLFLINPNGILFGEGARLDLSGSFTGTTSSGIAFGNNGFFSSINPEIPDGLLTIQPSAFLFERPSPSSIEIRSSAPNPSGGLGLQVNNAQSLKFIGGEFKLDGGQLNAPGGSIQVAALGEPSTVLLDEFRQFEILDSPQRSDIFFLNQARLSTIAGGSGETRIYGRKVSMSGGSQIVAGISPGVGIPSSESGNILVEATGDIELLSSSIGNAILEIGDGGRIEITGQSIKLKNGSTISSLNGGDGSAGAVVVRAEDEFSLSGRNANEVASGLFSASVSLNAFILSAVAGVEPTQVEEFLSALESIGINPADIPENTGNGGNLDIQAGSIRLTDGAQVVSTSVFSEGASGNIDIQVTNDIFAEGSANISTASYGQGDSGQIQIRTGGIVLDGATVSASTFGNGNAGNVNVTAEAIALKGTSPNGGISRISSEVALNATGTGGDVTVKTDSLDIRDGATVSASTFGNGNAGNVNVTADQRLTIDGTDPSGLSSSGIFTAAGLQNRAGDINLTTPQLRLENQGIISTFSNASDGGNIKANVDNAILFRRGSAIISAAGNDENPGNGGNITLNTPFLISLPNENSDIIANAFSETGGNITIDSNAILNFQVAPKSSVNALRNNRTNDISASSQFGTSGTLNLGGLNVDPSRGSTQLPINLTDSINQISGQCAAPLARSEFLVTGRGGLPQSPSEPLETSAPPAPWVAIPQADLALETLPQPASAAGLAQPPLTEATQWQTTANGTIQLIAAQPNNTKEVTPAVACASHLLSQQQ